MSPLHRRRPAVGCGFLLLAASACLGRHIIAEARTHHRPFLASPWKGRRLSSAGWLGGQPPCDVNDDNDLNDLGDASTTAILKAKKTRGGELAVTAETAIQPYVAVSMVVWGTPPATNRSLATFLPGCHLSSGTTNKANAQQVQWVGRGQWDGRNTPALWKTLAFLSDVLVLVLNAREPIDLDLVNALEAGFQARLKDLPKGRFLIVLHGDHTPEELLEWKARLTSTLEGSAPRIVEELVIVPAKDYSTTLRQMKRRSHSKPGVSQLADAETFPSLVQQVHKAFGGSNPSQRLLVPIASTDSDDDAPLVLEPKVEPAAVPSQPAAVTAAATAPAKVAPAKAAPTAPTGSAKASAAASAASAAPTSASSSSAPSQGDPELEQSLLAMANEVCDHLQLLQENVWLDGNKAREGSTIRPIDFASQANPRLNRLAQAVRQDSVPDAVRNKVVAHAKGRLRTLYQQQLEALRERAGRRYESALGRTPPSQWRKAATRATDGFRKEAERAVPHLLRPGEIWEDPDWKYYRSVAESGLISDMMQATDAKQDPSSLLDEDEDDDSVASSGSSKRLATWYEKLAARALVLGVNYLQGWLAWQGIKRAALLREQQMPKFPLF